MNKSIKKSNINHFGRYYISRKSYSPTRIAEYIDSYHAFISMNEREPTTSEFIKVSKIGNRELALKIIHYIKYRIDLYN